MDALPLKNVGFSPWPRIKVKYQAHTHTRKETTPHLKQKETTTTVRLLRQPMLKLHCSLLQQLFRLPACSSVFDIYLFQSPHSQHVPLTLQYCRGTLLSASSGSVLGLQLSKYFRYERKGTKSERGTMAQRNMLEGLLPRSGVNHSSHPW